MTEDEAKTKWCPQSFADHRPGASWGDGNSGGQYQGQGAGFRINCIGSECMMFRTMKVSTSSGDGLAKHEWTTNVVGYCGLGCKP